MSGQISEAAEGLVVGTEAPVGRFTYCVAEDRWWWSDTMYRIHGFEPGAIVPTTAILQAHKHPEDLAHTQQVLARALTTGEPFSCYHRILDSQCRARHVVAVADAAMTCDGVVVELRGYLVDLTASRQRDLDAETAAAIRGITESRASIEQAKGVLMFVYGVDPDTAFAILRSCSQVGNIKVRELAERLLRPGPGGPAAYPFAQRRLSEVLDLRR